MEMKDETKACKKALKDAGFKVESCKRGRGTAYGWIDVVIDDYRHKIINGKYTDQYPQIKHICYQITKDDQQCIEFKKHRLCSECIVSNCGKYHTPEMGACEGFLNDDLWHIQQLEHNEYADMIAAEKEADEIRKQSPEYLKEQEEIKIEREAEAYRKECEENREKLGHPWIYDGEGNRDNSASTPIPPKPPHAVKEIVITRAEGPIYLCDKPKYFDSFESASKWLRSQSWSFPKTGGYDKHDFRITFVDGQMYSGRLDCMPLESPNNDLDLLKHIIEVCSWYAGRAIMPFCGIDEYNRIVKGYDPEMVKAHGEFLDTYLADVEV